MQDLENLFKETFNNYEEPVRPELWDKISSQISQPAPSPSSSNGTSVASKGIQVAGKLIHRAGVWITGAAIVITAAASYYIYKNSSKNDSGIAVETSVPQPQNLNSPQNEVSSTDNQSVEPSTTQSTPSKANTASNKPALSVPTGNVDKISPVQNIGNQSAQNSNSDNSTNSLIANHPQTPTVINNNHQPVVQDQIQDQVPATINTAALESEIPAIIASPSSGYAPLTVNLTFQGSANDALWTISDGSEETNKISTEHTFERAGNYTVTLKTHDKEGKMHITRQNIEVLEGSFMDKIPNVFTPNGDGFNDIFTIRSGKLTSLDAAIFDKTGRQVYHWTDTDGGWDGKLESGQPAESGTYFYVIFATGADQKKYKFKGALSLIK